MPNKMLIDASHPEETRVVVTRGNRIEEFDFESQDKKQLRGNIYLARVTRVEPSLQAAFVEYGGNRHGFLAFSEIHPDYYQIPVADRQALLRADAEAAEAEDEEDEEERSGRKRRRSRNGKNRHRDEDRKAAGEGENEAATADDTGSSASTNGETLAEIEPFETTGFLSSTFSAPPAETDNQPAGDAQPDEEPVSNQQKDAAGHEADDSQDSSSTDENPAAQNDDDDDSSSGPAMAAAIEGDVVSEDLSESSSDDEGNVSEARSEDRSEPSNPDEEDQEEDPADEVESVGAEDAIEEAQPRRRANRRQYKIQEVIKRRQILLVQVVKEERGNKGAALTTYLSLAGRYSVLMPNTARGGGISRKITNIQDRKRLKDVMKDLEVPQGMGVILRTAGESRTKAEIKRDYEYLMRLWENVRTLTLQSTAPALVYEEGSLIKRSVRDLYNKEIDEIQVAGEEGYREAKDFMRMLMPSHAKMVQPYRDTVPIFARNGIEAQLDRMLQPQVNLKSGGYIIINQTEALVAIDVNSGRSTKEHSIEDTALQTNLEAADEVARQLRLRDLAGLIVVDFIDMEENRNNRAVEKRMKDALKNDRARIQVGRISHFGLLEMSRQRIRASVLESTTQTCPHCGGTGHIRSESSVALHVIRAIEEYLLKDNRSHIIVRTPVSTALYVLNHKRSTLVELERRFGLSISLEADETLGSQHYAITKGAAVENPVVIAPPTFEVVAEEDADDETVAPFDGENEGEEDGTELESREGQNGRGDQGERDQDRKRRRRRRRRGGRDRDSAQPQAGDSDQEHEASASEDDSDADAGAEENSDSSDVVSAGEGDQEQKKRRRGKRGGRRNRREDGDEQAASGDDTAQDGDQQPLAISVDGDADVVTAEAMAGIDPEGEIAPGEAGSVVAPEAAAPAEEAIASDTEAAAPAKAPRARARRPRKTAAATKKAAAEADSAEVEPVEQQAPPAPQIEEPQQEATAETQPVETAVEAPAAEEAPDAVQEELAATADESTRPSRRRASVDDAQGEPVVTSNVADTTPAEKPRKGGWWQRKSFF